MLFLAILQVILVGLQTCLSATSWDQREILGEYYPVSDDLLEKLNETKLARRQIPTLPSIYQAEWNLYVHPRNHPSPWYPRGIPPFPYETGRGATYYDFTIPAILERYKDFCLPVFGKVDYHWPCDMLHVNDTSYIVSDDRDAPFGKCCIWRKPWLVPTPDFVKEMHFDRTDVYRGELTDWYILGSRNQRYSYAFYWRRAARHINRIPGAFTYPLDKGWGGQNFFNVREKIRDRSVFDIPKACDDASYCIGPPV